MTEGEVLISGVVDLKEPLYAQVDLGTMTVHAQGKVYADTLRTLYAALPLQTQVKEYTGQQRSWSLTVFDRRIHLWGKAQGAAAGSEGYSDHHTLTLPGGRELPFILTCRTQREYTLVPGEIDRETGETLLKEHLLARLEQLMEKREGEIVQTQFSAQVEGGVLQVCLQARCSEQVGRETPFEGQVGRNLPTAEKQPAEN